MAIWNRNGAIELLMYKDKNGTVIEIGDIVKPIYDAAGRVTRCFYHCGEPCVEIESIGSFGLRVYFSAFNVKIINNIESTVQVRSRVERLIDAY